MSKLATLTEDIVPGVGDFSEDTAPEFPEAGDSPLLAENDEVFRPASEKGLTGKLNPYTNTHELNKLPLDGVRADALASMGNANADLNVASLQTGAFDPTIPGPDLTHAGESADFFHGPAVVYNNPYAQAAEGHVPEFSTTPMRVKESRFLDIITGILNWGLNAIAALLNPDHRFTPLEHPKHKQEQVTKEGGGHKQGQGQPKQEPPKQSPPEATNTQAIEPEAPNTNTPTADIGNTAGEVIEEVGQGASTVVEGTMEAAGNLTETVGEGVTNVTEGVL